MSTRRVWKQSEIKTNPLFSPRCAVLIESAFLWEQCQHTTCIFRHCTKRINTEPGVIVLDMPVYKPCEQGLPTDAKALVTNDGKTTGRYAKALVVLLAMKVMMVELSNIARDAVYDSRDKK